MKSRSRPSLCIFFSLSTLLLFFSHAFGNNETPNFSTECTPNLNLYTIFAINGLTFDEAKARCPLTKNGSGRQIARIDNSLDFETVRSLLIANRGSLSNVRIGVDALNSTSSTSNTNVFFFTDGNNANVNFIHGNSNVSPWRNSNPGGTSDRCVILFKDTNNPVNTAQDFLMDNGNCLQNINGVICREDCIRLPTFSPTHTPTRTPTHAPTKSPTKAPTKSPSRTPTHSPTKTPTRTPTKSPSLKPTASPTLAPTTRPTEAPHLPTISPSSAPVPALPVGNSSISGAVGGAVGGVIAFLMLLTIAVFIIMRRRGYLSNNGYSLNPKKNDTVRMAITISEDNVPMITDEKSILKPKFLHIDSTPIVSAAFEVPKINNAPSSTAFPIVSTTTKALPPLISSQTMESTKHKVKKKSPEYAVEEIISPESQKDIPKVDDTELLDRILMEGYKKPATPKTTSKSGTTIPLPIGMAMNTNVLQSTARRKKDKNANLDEPKEERGNLSTTAARPESLYLNNLDNKNRPESIFRPSTDYIKKAQDKKTKTKKERGTELSTDTPKGTNKDLDPKEPVALDENEL